LGFQAQALPQFQDQAIDLLEILLASGFHVFHGYESARTSLRACVQNCTTSSVFDIRNVTFDLSR